ncbi:hypothetical protein Hte_004021 [Hypoxylon texense]
MAYSSDSVYSGKVEWHQRSPNDPLRRPFAAWANCKPVAPTPVLTKEEQAYKDKEERLDKELWELMALRGAPRPEEDTPDASSSSSSEASSAEKNKPPRDPRLVLVLVRLGRAAAARCLSARDRLRARRADAARALDRRRYRAERWYREESVFPELFYVLRRVLQAVAAAALAALVVAAWWQGRRERRRGAEEGGGMLVYEHVPRYQVWSVTKPRCDCDAGCGKEGS